MKHKIEYITVFLSTFCAVYYRTVFYTPNHTLYIFVGQRHFSRLCVGVGGGGLGSLAGGDLPGLQSAQLRPPDLEPPSVSTAQYGIVQYIIILCIILLSYNKLCFLIHKSVYQFLILFLFF